MAGIAYRPAVLAEAPDLLAALREVAAEIPLRLDTLDREEALYRAIRNCARSGESSIAADASGRIVGFLLVEPNQTDRFWGESEALELRYGGVIAGHRRSGIFTELLRRVVERMVPLTATVPAGHRCGVERLLEAAGFARHTAPAGERYRREPGS